MRKIIITAFITLVSCYFLKTSEEFYSIDLSPYKSVVFVLDISGSMEGKDEGSIPEQLKGKAIEKTAELIEKKVGGGIAGKIAETLSERVAQEATKLGEAKRQLIPAIKGLKDGVKFDILTFSGDVKKWKGSLIEANSSNRNQAVLYVNGIKAIWEGTNIYDALKEAFNYQPEAIIFLSDGGANKGAVTDAQGIIEAVREWNKDKKVVLHTIGLGPDQDEYLLSTLAQENGGKYVKK